MLGLLAKVNKDKMKQEEKTNKKFGLEESAINILQNAVNEMQVKEKALANQLERDEISYSHIAKSKLERKLKQGVTAQQANKLESDMKSSCSKKEQKIETLKQKIKQHEINKETSIKEIDAKIERLESQKLTIISLVDAKIEGLEGAINSEEELLQRSENYFRPLIDRCYEEKPLDVVFPPSHFKKVQELKDLRSSIDTGKSNILVMKAAEFEDMQVNDKWEKEEIRLTKLREQSRREFLEREQEEKAREEEQRRIQVEQIQRDREAKERAKEEKRERDKENTRLMLLSLKEEGILEEEGLLE